MKKFLIRIVAYIFLILVVIEVLVRVFHLYTEDPPRFIDKLDVEKRVPGHKGYAVTGNRNQNFSEFNINEAGFNSHREFTPSKVKYEIALIGDSFIEGFHQDYYDSTGKKIEQQLNGVEVYEYGYAGYDLANQLHLMHSYKDEFELIDEIIVYLNYESDLERAEYEPNFGRITMLSSTVFKIRDNIKLLAYGSKIGILEPVKKLITGQGSENTSEDPEPEDEYEITPDMEQEYLENFKNLVRLYGFDKCKTTILLDSRKTSTSFLDYCEANNFKYIDFASKFEDASKPVTLIYDWHWNNHGRELIAECIVDFIKTRKNRDNCN
ncbi:hypothetical protein [Flagellimonas flava]|uniref:SGNH/GDSL hydrolase family protein n=1 Tax=Flagellimonas flava TaxID=570519 RepID=A0A1M5J843_9FLAO|nr:hypothetical protein [Allomuricauda flava]SHG36661.1 hypothetical protein SAMN04488116_1183 [Allomuricauda flava]